MHQPLKGSLAVDLGQDGNKSCLAFGSKRPLLFVNSSVDEEVDVSEYTQILLFMKHFLQLIVTICTGLYLGP